MKAFRYEALSRKQKQELVTRMSYRAFGRIVTIANLAFYSEETIIKACCCRTTTTGSECDCTWIMRAMTKSNGG